MIRIYSDGSHSPSLNGNKPEKTKGAIVIYRNDEIIDTASRIGPSGWSDVAEYVGIVLGLERLKALGLENEEIEWYGDNQFVMSFMKQGRVGKASKDYFQLAIRANQLCKDFKKISFIWIPREENKCADALSKL